MQTPCHHSTKVPRNGLPKIADRSAFRSRPATTLSGVRSRATTRAATGSNTIDRKSTRLNSSHDQISYAVFCLKKKKKQTKHQTICNEHQYTRTSRHVIASHN